MLTSNFHNCGVGPTSYAMTTIIIMPGNIFKPKTKDECVECP